MSSTYIAESQDSASPGKLSLSGVTCPRERERERDRPWSRPLSQPTSCYCAVKLWATVQMGMATSYLQKYSFSFERKIIHQSFVLTWEELFVF